MTEDDWLKPRVSGRHPHACTCAGCERVRRRRLGLGHPEDTGLISVHGSTCRCQGTGWRTCTKCSGRGVYQYKKRELFSRPKTLHCPHCTAGIVWCQDSRIRQSRPPQPETQTQPRPSGSVWQGIAVGLILATLVVASAATVTFGTGLVTLEEIGRLMP